MIVSPACFTKPLTGPVTGPGSSQMKRATSLVALFVYRSNLIVYPLRSALALKLTRPSSTVTEN